MKRVSVEQLKGSSSIPRSNQQQRSISTSSSSSSSSSYQPYNNSNYINNNNNFNNNNNNFNNNNNNNQTIVEKPTYDHFLSYYIFRKNKDEQSGKPISSAITVLDEWLDMKTDSKRTQQNCKIDWKQYPGYGGEGAEDHVRRRKLELELDNPSSTKRYIHSTLLSEWETYEITEIFQLEWYFTIAKVGLNSNTTINNNTSSIANTISNIAYTTTTNNKDNSIEAKNNLKNPIRKKQIQPEEVLIDEATVRETVRPTTISTSSNKSKKTDIKVNNDIHTKINKRRIIDDDIDDEQKEQERTKIDDERKRNQTKEQYKKASLEIEIKEQQNIDNNKLNKVVLNGNINQEAEFWSKLKSIDDFILEFLPNIDSISSSSDNYILSNDDDNSDFEIVV